MATESYVRHINEEQARADRDDLPLRYSDPESIASWHHQRMQSSIAPLLKHCSSTTWMTVGDGNFGTDANFLKPHVGSVIATSISAYTLKIAKAKGWIDDFAEQNAENMSFDDNAYDWVHCKAAYHHFPRPAIAFYEMLRVARYGVVLIEPADGAWNRLLWFKRAIKKVLRRRHAYDLFEPSGNFVFRVNVNEIAKMMTALNYRTVAWKGFNTFCYDPCLSHKRNSLSVGWVVSCLGILVQDVACWLRLLSPGIVTVICFKSAPGTELIGDLRSHGFRVVSLPVNPYIRSES